MYIFVGMLLGSLVTSTHDTKEACEGRRVVLAEKGVAGKCDIAPALVTWSTTTTTIACPRQNLDGTCR